MSVLSECYWGFMVFSCYDLVERYKCSFCNWSADEKVLYFYHNCDYLKRQLGLVNIPNELKTFFQCDQCEYKTI